LIARHQNFRGQIEDDHFGSKQRCSNQLFILPFLYSRGKPAPEIRQYSIGHIQSPHHSHQNQAKSYAGLSTTNLTVGSAPFAPTMHP